MDPLAMPQQNISGMSGAGELSLYQYFLSSPLFAQFVDFEGSERKAFLAQYVGLPSSLRNYLASTDTATTIVSAGLNYELDDSQVSRLAETIRELITGKIFIKDFPTTVSSKLGIDDVKAEEIVNKIVSQSFGPIIEDVKRIQRSKFPDKVMSMQKESRPSGLTQPSARPMGEARSEGAAQPMSLSPKPQISEELKNMPLSQPGVRQNVQSVRPPIAPVAPPIKPPLAPAQPISQQPVVPMRPPTPPAMNGLTSQGRQQPPLPQAKPEPIPNLPMQTRPLSVPRPEGVSRPPLPTPSIPPTQLKPPSLESKPSPEKQQFKVPDLGSLGEPPAPSRVDSISQTKPEETKKSLEEELEKVANIIDLRAKQGE